jgi:hypothetical protein
MNSSTFTLRVVVNDSSFGIRFSTTSICRQVSGEYNTTSKTSNLTYVCYFEHLLVVQGLLRFNDTREIDKLEGIQGIAYMKYSSAGV